GPLRDTSLRRRVAVALDRRALAANEDDDVPTSSLLPTRGEVPLTVSRSTEATPPLTLRMAVESDCWKCQQLAGLIAGQLRQVGITVTPVAVARIGTAMREPRSRIDLAALSTELPFNDPASFLTQMLGHDVPQSWVPAATFAAVK